MDAVEAGRQEGLVAVVVRFLCDNLRSQQWPGNMAGERTGQAQYEYSRPELLGSLSAHAVEAISSSAQRIVVCPTRPASLPWAAGYAEVRLKPN